MSLWPYFFWPTLYNVQVRWCHGKGICNWKKWMFVGIMSTERFLIWTFGNRLNVFSYSVAGWILCILLYFINLNFIMVYIEPITELWRNVFVIFDMMLGSESYVWTIMWWLIVTVYDMTFILSLKHCVDCSLSVLSVFIFTVFLPIWWINDIYNWNE